MAGRSRLILHGGAVGCAWTPSKLVRKNTADSDKGVVRRSGTTSFHVEWRGPFVQSTGSQLVAGHVDRPQCPFDRVGPHDRGTPTAHKRVGGPGPRACATGALFACLGPCRRVAFGAWDQRSAARRYARTPSSWVGLTVFRPSTRMQAASTTRRQATLIPGGKDLHMQAPLQPHTNANCAIEGQRPSANATAPVRAVDCTLVGKASPGKYPSGNE